MYPKNNLLQIQNITVTPGVSVLISVQDGITFRNGKHYDLKFCYPSTLQTVVDTITGVETVLIRSGVGTQIQVADNIGNAFYSGKLYHGRCYRLVYGNNGIPAGVVHFECLNTPCCSKYDPSGMPIPMVAEATAKASK